MTVNPDVSLPAGIYRHYKGPLYLVLGLAHDANAGELYDEWTAKDALAGVPSGSEPLGEREVVVYVGLQLDAAHEGARLAVRTLKDFFTKVCVNITHEHYGKGFVFDDTCRPTPRFSYVGPRFFDGMQT